MTGRRRFLHRVAMAAGAVPAILAGARRAAAGQVSIPSEFDTSLESIAASFRSGGAITLGYLSQPIMQGMYPGVMLAHDRSGLTTRAQGTTRNVAAAGFITLSPDFLSRLGGTASFRGVEADVNRAIESVAPETIVTIAGGAIAYVKSMKRVNGRIGALGFGWGGGAVLTSALAHPEIGACVVVDADIPPTLKSPERIRAPLLVILAGEDAAAVKGIAPLEAALEKHQRPHTVKVFPGVQRGFHDPGAAKLYNAAAAKEAWTMITQHFEMHLKGKA